MLRRAPARLTMSNRSLALVATVAVAAGCSPQHANLRRSDGLGESFAIVAASHWESDGLHYALLELEDPGGTRSDSSAKMSILFRFVSSPEGPRTKDAQVSLVRSLGRTSQCVRPSVQLLEQADQWSLNGSFLLSEGEKESLVSLQAFRIPLGRPALLRESSPCP